MKKAEKMRRAEGLRCARTDGRTYGRTDGRTHEWTDGEIGNDAKKADEDEVGRAATMCTVNLVERQINWRKKSKF